MGYIHLSYSRYLGDGYHPLSRPAQGRNLGLLTLAIWLIILGGVCLLPRPTMAQVTGGPGLPQRMNGDFHVEVLTPKVTFLVTPKPDTYQANEPLLLKVLAGRPGWQMNIKASHLTLKGNEKIWAREVCLVAENGTMVPLQQPVEIVKDGRPGLSELKLDLALVTSELHDPGLYSGWLFITSSHPCGPSSPMIKVPVEVEVRLAVSHNISGNRLYFHVGNSFKAGEISGIINGQVQADAPLNLIISNPTDPVTKLSLRRSFSDTTRQKCAAVIPVSWQLGEAGGDLRPPDRTDDHGQSVSWHLRGTPGDISYQLKCLLKPTPEQAPGDYGLSATVTLVPLL